MAERVICDLCGRVVPPHAHYVVKVEVYADPTSPDLSSEELEEADFDGTLAELLKELEQYSVDELQDQVHRAFEYRLCRPCQAKFLINPLGRPRDGRPGTN